MGFETKLFCSFKTLSFGTPISAPSFDDQLTYGYMFETAQPPKGIIVLMHGGPHRAAPFYSNSKIDFFLKKGYHVLQSNYRGSPGHGLDYIKSGFGITAKAMGRDAYALGKAYQKQTHHEALLPLHLLGESWGGYAALASYHDPAAQWDSVTMIGAPCRISSRLEAFIASNFSKNIKINYQKANSANFLNIFYSLPRATQSQSKQQVLSNSNYCDNVLDQNVPVSIIHGEKDETVMLSDLKAFLALNEGRYGLQIIPDAGHGLKNIDITPYLERMIAKIEP